MMSRFVKSRKMTEKDLQRRGFRSVPKHLRRFTVAECKHGEKEMIRVNSEHMDILGVKSGEEVWISKFSHIGGKIAGKVAEAYPEDEDQDIVRISRDLLNKAKKEPASTIEIGDKVRVLSRRFMDFSLT